MPKARPSKRGTDASGSLSRTPLPPSQLARCLPAPASVDAARFRLTDATGKLMEKRLRSLLARCPEWNDAAERLRLALELEQAADSSGAVEVLRSRSCASMRKRAMLRLSFSWRYRSDCWSARADVAASAADGAVAKRQRPSADETGNKRPRPAHSKQVTLPLRDRSFVNVDAARGQVLQLMTPHIAAVARSGTGPLSSVQYGRAHGLGMTWLRVRTVEGAVEVSHWLQAVCTLRLHALRAWRDTLSSEQLRSAAFLADAAYNTPESELEALRYILSQAHASTHSVAEAQRQGGTLRPQDSAWVRDFDIGHHEVLAMVGTGLQIVATQRMEPLRSFIDAAEAVLGGLCLYTQEASRSLIVRVDWCREAAQSQGPAAGVRPEANACVPPLVARLKLTNDCEQGVALLALASVPPPMGMPPQRFTITMHTSR